MPVDRLRFMGHSGIGAGSLPLPGRRPLRGLVVDGAARTRRLLCRAGQRAAGDDSLWLEASEASAAMVLLGGCEIDLVVADPGSIGCNVEVLTAFARRSGGPGPAVVIVSDDDGPGGIQQMLDAGVACFLSKHLPERILESQLRRLVSELLEATAHSIRGPGRPA